MMRAMHRQRGRQRATRGLRGKRSIVAIALCCAGIVLAAAFVGITVQANALAREISTLHADITAAQSDRAQLQQTIADQHTDDYVVQKARDYGYIGTNESLYAVQRNEQGTAQSSSTVSGPSRIERWIVFFFGGR
jgi:cell division protein FtsB